MKKRILTVLIAIITVIPLVLVVPKAATVTSTVTSYGSYTVTYEDNQTSGFSIGLGNLGFEIPITGGSTVTFRYDFNAAKTGSFQLNVTTYGNYILGDCYFSLDGGTFTTIPSLTVSSKNKAFKITFTNTKYVYFTLYIPYPTQFANITAPISLTSVNIQDGIDLQDIDTTLDSLNSTIDLYLPGMSTSLSNIASNTSTIATDLATIKGYLDGLEGYTDTIEPLLNDILFQSQINQFDFPNYQHSALYWGYAQVRGTSTHPALEFWRGLPVFYLLMSEVNDSAFTQAKAIRVPGNSTICIYLSSNRLFDSSLFNTYTSSDSDFTVTYSANYNTVYQNIYNVITVKNNLSSTKYIEFEPTANMYIMPYFLGSPANVPDELKSLFGLEFDNTYTRLLQSINNAVGGEPYDTSQYDQYEQTMDGLNDSLRDRFNNVDDNMQTNIDTLFTPSGTAGSDGSIFEKFNFNGVNSLFTGILNGIFTSFPAFKYILLFALLLLVIGVMI